jgi:hypothetical protein
MRTFEDTEGTCVLGSAVSSIDSVYFVLNGSNFKDLILYDVVNRNKVSIR